MVWGKMWTGLVNGLTVRSPWSMHPPSGHVFLFKTSEAVSLRGSLLYVKQNINSHRVWMCGQQAVPERRECWRPSWRGGGEVLFPSQRPLVACRQAESADHFRSASAPLSAAAARAVVCLYRFAICQRLFREAWETVTSGGVCWRKLTFQNRKAFWLVKWKKTVWPLCP